MEVRIFFNQNKYYSIFFKYMYTGRQMDIINTLAECYHTFHLKGIMRIKTGKRNPSYHTYLAPPPPRTRPIEVPVRNLANLLTSDILSASVLLSSEYTSNCKEKTNFCSFSWTHTSYNCPFIRN